MPAKSEEALAKKRQTRKARRARNRKSIIITRDMLPSYKISARRMMPKLPDMSKAELREMLTKAVTNTSTAS